MSTTPDDPLIKALKGATAAIGTLQQDTPGLITTVSTFKEDSKKVATTLDKVNNISKKLEEFLKLVKLIATLCAENEEIPVIPEVAMVVRNSVNTVNSSINEFQKLLKSLTSKADKVEETISKLYNGLSAANRKIEQCHNALQVVENAYLIATLIIKMVELFKPNEQLVRVTERFTTETNSILSNINSVVTDFSGISGTLKDAAQFAEQKGKDVEGFVESFDAKFGPAIEFLNNLSHTINEVLSFFAPVKWVLDGLSFLYDHIIQPLIDKAKGMLGIDKLEKEIQEKVEEYAGIENIKKSIDGLFAKLEGDIKMLENPVKDFTEKLDNLVENVKKFSEDPVKEIMKEFIEAYFNVSLKDGIPDPNLQTLKPPKISAITQKPMAASIEDEEDDENIHLRLDFAQLIVTEMQISPSGQISIDDLPLVITNIRDTIHKTQENITAVKVPVDALVANLNLPLDGDMTLPTQLASQLSDISNLLVIAKESTDFVHQFSKQLPGPVTDIIDKFRNTITTIGGKVSKLSSDTKTLKENYDKWVNVVQGVIAFQSERSQQTSAVDLAKALDQTSRSLGHWPETLDSINAIVKEEYTLGGAKYKSDLDSVSKSLVIAAQEAHNKNLIGINNMLSSVFDNSYALNDDMETFSKCIAQLHDGKSKLKSTLKAVSEATHYAQCLEVALKPLEWYLSTPEFMSGYFGELLFKPFSDFAIPELEDGLNQISKQLDEVIRIVADSNQKLAGLTDSHATLYKNHLTQLTEYVQGYKDYKIQATDPKTKKTSNKIVTNVFISDELANSITRVSTEIQNSGIKP